MAGIPRKIDRIDRRLMHALTENGRLTNSELADRVGLSPAPCWQRVRRLESDGYIQGYTAILDQRMLGARETVLLEVTLDRHDDEAVANFGRLVTAMPEVLEVYLTTGEYDYLLKVAVDGTQGYADFMAKKIYKIPGVRHTRSSFTLGCLKRSISVSPLADE